jgi:hypothetical protein
MIRLPIGTRYLFMKQRGKARGSGSIYLKKGSGIRVMLHEPKTEPFVMVAKRDRNELKLHYEWKSAQRVCTYQQKL